MNSIVLDAEAVSAAARGTSATVMAALRFAREDGAEVYVPAAVLAEVYRGVGHDQMIDAFLGREDRIQVVNTDRPMARRIGHILATAGSGSKDHVDATVAAVAVGQARAVIFTGDPDDLNRLLGDVKTIRVEAI